MDELAARLEALFRRHAEALDRLEGEGEPVIEQFQKQFRLLITQYGEGAVEDALNHFRAGPERTSVSLRR